jgi:hypothetical protein
MCGEMRRPCIHGRDSTHEDIDAIAERIADRHRRVHQADVRVHEHAHRCPGDFAQPWRWPRRVPQAQQHFGVAIAEQIDEAFVESAEARPD